MKLHGRLCDELPVVTGGGFRGRNGPAPGIAFDRDILIRPICERRQVFPRDMHIDDTVPDNLLRGERLTERDARFAVRLRALIQERGN